MAGIGEKVRYRHSSERRLREVGEALYVLESIDQDWLWEMQRRREQLATPDGLGSPSLNGGSKSSDDTSTTERTAINARRGCRRPRYIKVEGLKARICAECGRKAVDHVSDPIGAGVEEVFELLDRATQALRTLHRRAEVILLAADGHRGRMSSLGDCLACGNTVTGMGEDRLKAGYGPCCYQAWRRWAEKRDYDGVDISHVVFRQERKAYLDEEKHKAEEAESAAKKQGA
jgi:hypothetical protein